MVKSPPPPPPPPGVGRGGRGYRLAHGLAGLSEESSAGLVSGGDAHLVGLQDCRQGT